MTKGTIMRLPLMRTLLALAGLGSTAATALPAPPGESEERARIGTIPRATDKASLKRARRAHAPSFVVLAACGALLVAGCGSSTSKASNTTAASKKTGNTSGNVSTDTTSPSGSSTTTTSATATLPADICKILDVSTASSTLAAPNITSTRSMGNADNEPSCLWGTLGPNPSVQVTAFTGTDLARRKAGWTIAFPAVKGAGNAAWSRGVVPIGSNKNVVLYVDYGNFGLEFALGGPKVTVDQAVTLASKIK
jgi:hypothetical protein